MGAIGKVKISRLICGGNLINGYAHSRNLVYVSALMKHYFTDEKVMETFALCETEGINTMVGNNNQGENTARLLKMHWDRGGKIQWLAQVNPTVEDVQTNIKSAVDAGAAGAFIQGAVSDKMAAENPDALGKAVSFIKEQGLIAGVGGHSIKTQMTCGEKGIVPDFFFKTLNTVDYHCNDPEDTIKFMEKWERPWIAFKVLGAGVTSPSVGFKYAFKSGADFLCVGMFDFQVKEDAHIAKDILGRDIGRTRSWRG